MFPPDGHGTKGADPILAVPSEEMEIDLKGGNFEWKTFLLLAFQPGFCSKVLAPRFYNGRAGFQMEIFILGARNLSSLG